MLIFSKGYLVRLSDDGAQVFKGGSAPVARFGNTQMQAGPGGDLRKKRLPEGEHATPPKGYPEERDQYAVPESYLFPINNAEHTRAAIGYFSHHAWKPQEHKKTAAARILRAAKKFGIHVGADSSVARAARS